MEYEDQTEEHQEGQLGLQPTYNDSVTPLKIPVPNPTAEAEAPLRRTRYKECLKNHAVAIGGHAVDGCGEFMAAGADGTLESLKCASCNCHRNFHRKETETAAFGFHHHQQQLLLTHHPHGHFGYPSPSGYLHVAPPQRAPPPMTLPSSSGGGGSREEMDHVDYYSINPSSSGGKKRFRTRFTQEQKDKMLSLAERLGWKIQKQDEEIIQQFCNEVGLKRHVLKVWMHNNKHTLGKKTEYSLIG